MSIVAAELIAEITVKGAEAAIGQIEGLGGVVGHVGGILANFGLDAAKDLVGIGAESVKMAGDFQQSLTQLVTGAGESQKNLQMVSDGILNLAVATGTSTGQLTEAMYMIESAGYRGASALDVLKASAEGAKAGNADLGTTAKAVTIVMHDYASSHITATQAANALIATEQNGQAHLQELAKSMGAVLPIASAAGVSFQDVAGAIALMTTGGMTAQHASQNLANAIRSLEAPSSVAQKAMQSVGLSAQDLKDTLSTKGLDGAIQLISDDVGRKFPAGSVQSVEAFKAIMGGAAGYNVALQLGGAHMKAYQDDIKKIGDALHKGGSDVEGFALVQQNFNFKLDQAKEAINVLMIRLGTALLPVLGQVLTAVTPLILRFADWVQNSNYVNVALQAVGNAVVTVTGILNGAIGVVQAILAWWNQWKGLIESVSIVITTYFAPALILAGVQATVSAARITASFIASLIQTGVESVVNAAKVTTSFVASLVLAGDAGWTAAARIVTGFIPAMVTTGAQAVVNAAKVTGAFIASMVESGTAAVVNGTKVVASFVASLIVTAAQAIATAAVVSGQFIVSLVETAVQAVITGDIISLSLVPALIATIAQAMIAAVIALPALVAGFIAWAGAATGAAIATIAATWPILAIGALIALVVAGIITATGKWGAIGQWLVGVWQGVQGFFQGFVNSITGGSAHMQLGVTGSTQQMSGSVQAAFASMENGSLGSLNGMTGTTQRLFDEMKAAGESSAWEMDASVRQAFANVAGYIDAANARAANAAAAQQIQQQHLSPGIAKNFFAEGTSFAPGGMAVVGERGPELMYVPRGAQIIPVSNPQLRAATQSQPTIIVQPPSIYLDGRLLANGLMPHITSAIRYGTGVR